MTSFRSFLADTIREYFAIPRVSHETQVAASNWQPSRLSHLERQPGYKPGQYARHYHNQLVTATQTAMKPNLTRIATTPLAARDIQYASTPLPSIEDEDATERRPAIKRRQPTTQEIPAITAEIMLMEMMRGPVSPHDTGEQAPVVLATEVNEDAFLL